MARSRSRRRSRRSRSRKRKSRRRSRRRRSRSRSRRLGKKKKQQTNLPPRMLPPTVPPDVEDLIFEYVAPLGPTGLTGRRHNRALALRLRRNKEKFRQRQRRRDLLRKKYRAEYKKRHTWTDGPRKSLWDNPNDSGPMPTSSSSGFTTPPASSDGMVILISSE